MNYVNSWSAFSEPLSRKRATEFDDFISSLKRPQFQAFSRTENHHQMKESKDKSCLISITRRVLVVRFRLHWVYTMWSLFYRQLSVGGKLSANWQICISEPQLFTIFANPKMIFNGLSHRVVMDAVSFVTFTDNHNERVFLTMFIGLSFKCQWEIIARKRLSLHGQDLPCLWNTSISGCWVVCITLSRAQWRRPALPTECSPLSGGLYYLWAVSWSFFMTLNGTG